MTIIDFLRDRAVRNADDLAFRFMENGDLDGPVIEWTFAELFRQSAGVANDLIDQGLQGSNVLLAFPPGLDFVKAFYGCLLAGVRAVPVPLPNPRSKNPLGRILGTARSCGATQGLTTEEIAKRVGAMVPDLPITLHAVTEQIADASSVPLPDMDAIAYLQFTSGSTGHPKGVAVSHANAIANLRVMGQMLRIKSDQPSIVWAPHYHDLCLVGHILGPVFHGFESTLMSPLDFLFKPVRWLQAMSYYKIANTACPNFGYEYAINRIKDEACEGLDLSHWRIAGNGGEPVLPATLKRFTKKFSPYGFKPSAFMPCYGIAESVLFVGGLKPLTEPPKVLRLSADALEQHTITVLDDAAPDERVVVSCGATGADHQVIAVDPVTCVPCEPDQVGELWLKGPSVPDFYWGLEDESTATFQARLAGTGEGPYLRTGDLGFVSAGEIYVTGRLKDMIIIAGRNHYPADIELTVHQCGAPIRLGTCIAFSRNMDGAEALVVIAEVDDRKTPEAGTEPERVNAFWDTAVKTVQGAISKNHGIAVNTVVFVTPRSLEKTSSGKPRRRYYKQQFAEGGLSVVYAKEMPHAA